MISSSCCTILHAYANSFEDNLNGLLTQMVDKERIISLSFFGASTDDSYEKELKAIESAVSNAFGGQVPLVSYIALSLSDPEKMAVEVHYFPTNLSLESVVYKNQENDRYVVFEWNETKILVIEGLRAKSLLGSISTQCKEIFQKIKTIMSDEQMHEHEIVRQWNYIGKITALDHGIQNYQAFNDVRDRFYSKTNWKKYGYPAATAVGMEINSLIVSLIAVSCESKLKIIPVYNPLQIAPQHYSQTLLLGQTIYDSKATPKFERAKVVQNDSAIYCFISGTAAIRGEQSMKEMDVALQTKQAIENILYLISSENIKSHGFTKENNMIMKVIRVYIKEKESFDIVKTEVEKVWPGLPTIYLQADICRSELLVEIEGFYGCHPLKG